MQTFDDLLIHPLLLRAITAMGFEKPSPIQAQAFKALLGQSNDFIGLAATGTGKTAAFAIPLLERIDPALRKIQGLVLCPTRELALQVSGQINLMGKFLGIEALPIYGGASYGDQLNGLKKGLQIVVGTPGRLVDHMERGRMDLSHVLTVVLDEADEMISMGFKEDLKTLLSATANEQRNTWLFSATMSREVRKVADEYLNHPEQAEVNRTEMLSSTVEQFYYMTQESNKPEILCKLIDAAQDFYGLVFCQTKSLVMDLTTYLTDQGYKVDNLHGDKDQNSRERTMQAFRDRKVNLLICTDVASRGLDVKDVTHVINYSIPRELDSYVHRIGRTARSGKTGYAMSLVTPSHRPLIGRIEKMTKSRMQEGKVPTRKDIGLKKISQFLDIFKAQSAHPRATEMLTAEWKSLLKEMSADEVAGRFLVLKFPELFNDSKIVNTPLRSQAPSYKDRAGFSPRGGDSMDRSNKKPRGHFGGDRDRSRDKSAASPASYGQKNERWGGKKKFSRFEKPRY